MATALQEASPSKDSLTWPQYVQTNRVGIVGMSGSAEIVHELLTRIQSHLADKEQYLGSGSFISRTDWKASFPKYSTITSHHEPEVAPSWKLDFKRELSLRVNNQRNLELLSTDAVIVGSSNWTPIAFPDPDAERFSRLKAEWIRSLGPSSRPRDMAMAWPYQCIIGMGSTAIPFLLRELEIEPNHWFWALEAITETDPIPIESRGNIKLMADAWIQWGRQNGYLIISDGGFTYPA